MFEGWSDETLMAQADEVSRRLDQLPARIREGRASGEAGNGTVFAHVDGAGRLAGLEVRRAAECDARRLGHQVVEAIGQAEAAAARMRADLLDEFTFAGRPLRDYLPSA